MYIPGHFEQTDSTAIRKIVREWPFATVISLQDGLPCADHLPVLSVEAGDDWQLYLHVSRKNSLWQCMERNECLLLVFAGPNAYVSPDWYGSPGVPTWNYAAVHIRVEPRVLDAHATQDLLRRQMADAEQRWGNTPPAPFNADLGSRLQEQIGAAQLHVKDVEAKFKLSQNRPPVDQQAVMQRLEQRADQSAQAVAQLMRARYTL